MRHHRKQLENLCRHPHLASPLTIIEPHLQRIDDLRSDLNLAVKRNLSEKALQLASLKKQTILLKPSSQIGVLKQKLEPFRKQLDQRLRESIQQKKQKLCQLVSHLKGIDPKNLLTKGYCILFQEKNDSVILSTSELALEDRVRLKLHDGKALLTVSEILK